MDNEHKYKCKICDIVDIVEKGAIITIGKITVGTTIKNNDVALIKLYEDKLSEYNKYELNKC